MTAAVPLRVALDAGPLLGVESGVGSFCRGLLEALAEAETVDVSAYAVTWRRQRDLAGSVPPGVPVRQAMMAARPLHLAWRLAEWPRLESFIGAVDVVHGTNFVVPPTAAAARVITVHDLTPVRFPEMCQPATLAYPALIRKALRHGAWIHTHSRFVAEEVVDHFGVDPARVVAVPSGIPPLPSASPTGTAEGGSSLLPDPVRRYVLAIGTVEPRKDYPSLVRAFDLLAGDGADLGLVIVGADGWGSERLAEAVAASPHRDRIVRLGYLEAPRVRWLLDHAAVLAFPSRYEGFGYPPLQAMSAGVPVVTTRAGSIPEVVGDAAVLVDPGDAAGLATALAGVIDDAARRSELAEAGRRQVAGYTWRRCAEGLEQVYRAAVSG